MKLSILTLFPEMFTDFLQTSIVGIATKKQIVSVDLINIRDFATKPSRQVDDYPYGGGGGMVLKPDVVYRALSSIDKFKEKKVVYFTPQGKVLNQHHAEVFSKDNELILLCGHYKGIDMRIRKLFVTDEVSIGDYVLSGGELPAMVFIDSITRLQSGVLGNFDSAKTDSFQNGLLGHPVYTRPQEFESESVPNVLISGNHAKIEEFRLNQAKRITAKNRPDLLENL